MDVHVSPHKVAKLLKSNSETDRWSLILTPCSVEYVYSYFLLAQVILRITYACHLPLSLLKYFVCFCFLQDASKLTRKIDVPPHKVANLLQSNMQQIEVCHHSLLLRGLDLRLTTIVALLVWAEACLGLMGGNGVVLR